MGHSVGVVVVVVALVVGVGVVAAPESSRVESSRFAAFAVMEAGASGGEIQCAPTVEVDERPENGRNGELGIARDRPMRRPRWVHVLPSLVDR